MKLKLSATITPKDGDLKTEVRRAWIPKKVAGCLVWLIQYEYLFVYQSNDVKAIIEGKEVIFKVGQWIKVSEALIKWQTTSVIG